jgi:hypothetical protein
MAKKTVICPECGYKHTVTFRGIPGQTIGVRYQRITPSQFNTAIDVPGELIEYDRYYTLGHQLLAAGVVGVSSGTLIGYFVSIPWHVSDIYLTAEIIIGSTLTGWAVSWAWLAKERAWQLGKALPSAINHYLALSNESKPSDEGVALTVDHRYRDGNTEAGRTVNRFGTLPVDVERFNEWAQSALVGKSLAVSNWTPLARMFTRPEYDHLLAKLTAGGIIVNLGSNKGNTLTGGGKRALTRHLIDCGITPPSPAGETDFLGERFAQIKETNGGNTPLPRSEVRVGGENG